MSIMKKFVGGLVILVVGYFLGVNQSSLTNEALAQRKSDVGSAEILKIRNAFGAMGEVRQELVANQKHQISLSVLNPLAVCSGGVNSLTDLERGTGVDPITYGALYAGMADVSISSEISFDEDGRLMYRDKVVRLYSPKRMKELFSRFQKVTTGK